MTFNGIRVGSLLAAVARPKGEALKGIRRICRTGAAGS